MNLSGSVLELAYKSPCSLFVKMVAEEQRTWQSRLHLWLLMQMLSCWNGPRKTTAAFFMLSIVLVISIAPSSKFSSFLLWISLFSVFLFMAMYFPSSGSTLNALGWNSCELEMSQKRSIPMHSWGLVPSNLRSSSSWFTVRGFNNFSESSHNLLPSSIQTCVEIIQIME